jgi:hypothetical protein
VAQGAGGRQGSRWREGVGRGNGPKVTRQAKRFGGGGGGAGHEVRSRHAGARVALSWPGWAPWGLGQPEAAPAAGLGPVHVANLKGAQEQRNKAPYCYDRLFMVKMLQSAYIPQLKAAQEQRKTALGRRNLRGRDGRYLRHIYSHIEPHAP